ncbi:hypothetical protein BDD12DRAFT_865761 [Trichophaea hybrida]|nr:hypothetical protein BDD12DRAFT_865761 [Trichophaea hybrida]
MSALHLHLHLEKLSKNPSPKPETVLMWGGASTLGSYSIQIAAQSGIKLSPPHGPNMPNTYTSLVPRR